MGTVIQLKDQINNSYFQLKNSVEEKLILVEVKEITETSYKTLDLNKFNELSDIKFSIPNRYTYTSWFV